uniref:T-complex protein 1 subunit eta n=1 Tax=Accipiter nisus TaxID=211598 RepID=A0A8B9MIA5_9AVES
MFGLFELCLNINACQVIAEAVRTTLGPRGMDKLIVDDRGKHWAVAFHIFTNRNCNNFY